MIDMRNDIENGRYTNWTVSYLFGTFLFNKNIAMMGYIELLFVSFLSLCKNVTSPVNRELSENEKTYKRRILSGFQCLCDFYTVMFKNLKIGLGTFMTTNKKTGADGKKVYLRTTKIANFFEQSGKKFLLNTQTSKKRENEINFKFLKILLERCDEFVEFIKFVYKPDIENHFDFIELQFIAILNQIIIEAEEKRKKIEEEESKEAEKISADKKDKSDEQPDLAAIEDKETPPLIKHPSSKDGRGLKRVFSYEQKKRMLEKDTITLDDDDEDEELEARHPVRKPHASHQSHLDDRTKKYLELVKGYAYEDEYDDTHDTGDRFRNKQRQQARIQEEMIKENDPEDEDGDDNKNRYRDEIGGKEQAMAVEEEDEDSLEAPDLMSKWDRQQSRKEGDNGEDEEPAIQGRGGYRGGRGARGGKRDMKREKYNQSKYAHHEQSRKDFNPHESYYFKKNQQGGDYHQPHEQSSHNRQQPQNSGYVQKGGRDNRDTRDNYDSGYQASHGEGNDGYYSRGGRGGRGGYDRDDRRGGNRGRGGNTRAERDTR